MGVKKYENGVELTLHPEALAEPFKWRKPTLVFTNSMSDFFHERIPFEFIDDVIQVIRQTPQHRYQVLTKRSWRMMKYGERIGRFPDNVWLGVSVAIPEAKFRVEHLQKCDVRTRFLSVEPLLSPLGKLDLTGIDWVICGGESGRHLLDSQTRRHRALVDLVDNKWIPHQDKVAWVSEIRDQCAMAGVPFFFKQWGGIKPKSGGRLLDGREWNEFPRMEPLLLATRR
jgi:protein gp37